MFRAFLRKYWSAFDNSLVVARYSDDGRWYRAWIKSICLQRQQALVFFVDFGNESSVAFTDIYTCPETVRTLPWLGIRIRLVDEKMSYDELMTFWKIAESHYIWIKVVEKFKDSYGVQINMDYTIFLRYERSKAASMHRLVHTAVQVRRAISNNVSSNALEFRRFQRNIHLYQQLIHRIIPR